MRHGNDRVGTPVKHQSAHRNNSRGSQSLFKAFTHPLRVAILARVDEEVLSPKQLAAELGVSLPVVSYHVRELERLKMIELVRTAQRRGAVQHWYRAKPGAALAQREWSAASASTRREIVSVALARLEAAAASASEEGGFDRADVQVSRETIALDERGFGELAALIEEVRGRVEKLSQAARSRLTTSGAQPVHATVSLMLFEGPYGNSRRAPRRRKTAPARVGFG
jgi:DNA-binding transcriptional ArsR family regulator